MVCDFPLITFEHCNRKVDKVTHKLARLARLFTTYDWFEEPLNDIVTLLIDDVMNKVFLLLKKTFRTTRERK